MTSTDKGIYTVKHKREMQGVSYGVLKAEASWSSPEVHARVPSHPQSGGKWCPLLYGFLNSCEWNSHVFSAAGMVGHCVFRSLHVPPRHQPRPSVPAAPGVS